MPKTPPKLPPYVIVENGRWFVCRSFPSKETYANGRKKYIQIKRRCEPETEDRAEELAGEIAAAYNEALVVASQPLTLGEYLKRFLSAKRNSVARRTYDIYKEAFDRFVTGSALEHIQLAALSPMLLQDYVRDLQDNGVPSSSIRSFFSNLTTAFRQAVKWEQLDRDPTNGLILPKGKDRPAVPMTEQQAKQFLEACALDPSRIVFEFALETGMRPGEYLALRWKDLDLINCTATVSQAIAVNLSGGGFEIKEPKTKGSRRTIEISQRLRNRLMEHRRNLDKELDEIRARTTPEGLKYVRKNRRRRAARVSAEKLKAYAEYDLVFPSTTGVPMSRMNLRKREFADTLADAGLTGRGFHPYTLRHTCATLMLVAGVNVKAVAEKLGHASINMTLEVYAHVIPSMRDDAVQRLAKVLYA